MATAEMTEKQRAAFEALQGARREGRSLSEYAKAHGLAIWELYNALACLRRKGLLPKSGRKSRNKFIAVRVMPERPVTVASPVLGGAVLCRLVHRGGYLIECMQWPPALWLASLKDASDAACHRSA